MKDQEIISLYWNRNERAITETDKAYGKLLFKTAFYILSNYEDAEETVNDTYLRVWHSIPDDKPAYFSGYLMKILRSLSIDLLRRNTAIKRGGKEYLRSLDELQECETAGPDPQTEVEIKLLKTTIEAFLYGFEENRRNVFIQRYFYAYPIKLIAKNTHMTESNVKTILHRMRQELRVYLEKEGYR